VPQFEVIPASLALFLVSIAGNCLFMVRSASTRREDWKDAVKRGGIPVVALANLGEQARRWLRIGISNARAVQGARLPLTKNTAWAKGARIALAVTNLFDTRQAVRDATGMTPSAFEPGLLDPPGRVLAITVGKVF
jgi:hypothetical protein